MNCDEDIQKIYYLTVMIVGKTGTEKSMLVDEEGKKN